MRLSEISVLDAKKTEVSLAWSSWLQDNLAPSLLSSTSSRRLDLINKDGCLTKKPSRVRHSHWIRRLCRIALRRRTSALRAHQPHRQSHSPSWPLLTLVRRHSFAQNHDNKWRWADTSAEVGDAAHGRVRLAFSPPLLSHAESSASPMQWHSIRYCSKGMSLLSPSSNPHLGPLLPFPVEEHRRQHWNSHKAVCFRLSWLRSWSR